MKTQKLIEFIKKQLGNAENKETRQNKKLGGRLFDGYGIDLNDFPTEIVDHVKNFRSENVEIWTKELYQLISQWIEQALQQDKNLKNNLFTYLRKFPIKEFISGFYLAICQHVTANTTTEFDRDFSSLALANIIGKINLGFYRLPLEEDKDLELTYHFQTKMGERYVQKSIQEAEQKFITILAEKIIETPRSSQQLEEIIKRLSKEKLDLLLNELASQLSIIADNLNKNFPNETDWENLENVINFLIKCDKIEDSRFYEIRQWINSNPERTQKLSDKIISHPHFAKFYPDYQKSQHSFARHVIDTDSYIKNMKSLNNTVKRMIQESPDVQRIDGAANWFKSVMKSNEAKFGNPDEVKQQLVDIKDLVSVRKRIPAVGYTSFILADKLKDQVIKDINASDTITSIDEITAAALKRIEIIIPGENNEKTRSTYKAAIEDYAHEKILKQMIEAIDLSDNIKSINEITATALKKIIEHRAVVEAYAYIAILKLQLHNVNDEKTLHRAKTVALEKIDALLIGRGSKQHLTECRTQAHRLAFSFNELANQLIKVQTEDQKTLNPVLDQLNSAMLDKLVAMTKSVFATEVQRCAELKQESPAADHLIPLLTEHYKEQILALKLDDASLIKLKERSDDNINGIFVRDFGLGQKAYIVASAQIGWTKALMEIMQENFLNSAKKLMNDFTSSLESASTIDEVNKLASATKKSLSSLKQKTFPEPELEQDEDDEEDSEKETSFQEISKIIDYASRKKINELQENFINSAKKTIDEFTHDLQSASTIDEVHKLALVAKESLSVFKQDEEKNFEKETSLEKIYNKIDYASRNKIKEFELLEDKFVETKFKPYIMPHVEKFQSALQSAKTVDRVHEIAVNAKIFVKNELSSKLGPKDGSVDIERHLKKLFEQFDEMARNKISELTATPELKSINKDTAKQILNSSLRKNPNLYKIFKYIAYSAGGLLAAKLLLPHHMLIAVSQIGVEGVRAIINNPSVQAGIGIVSGAIATGIGLFKKSSQPGEPNDKQTDEKVLKIIVDIVNEKLNQCQRNFDSQKIQSPASRAYARQLRLYDTLLNIHAHSSASYLLNVVEIIKTDKQDNQLGGMLADALKTGFGIENISNNELLTQLKALVENQVGTEVTQLCEKFNGLLKKPETLAEKIISHLTLERLDPTLLSLYTKLHTVTDPLQKLKLIKEELTAQDASRLTITHALNQACETNAATEIWVKALDQSLNAAPAKAVILGR